MEPPAHAYESLEEEVLHLPLDERSRLANRLLESLDQDDGFELSPEWLAELDRRAEDVDKGRVGLIPHDDVVALVNARVAEIRSGDR